MIQSRASEKIKDSITVHCTLSIP